MNDDPIIAHVLQICSRTEKGQGFTLSEVIARVVLERPDMIMGFSTAWGALIRTKKVRIMRAGEPCLYELVDHAE
jgi:hypothetical protein